MARATCTTIVITNAWIAMATKLAPPPTKNCRNMHSSLVLIAVMIPTISVLMAAHVIEVFAWALAYSIFGVAPAGANLIYFAFVNYATLGYGDVLPVEGWRLLSPLTAMNGMLLFWMVDRSHFRGPTANLGAHPRYQRLTEVSSLTPGNIGALCRGL